MTTETITTPIKIDHYRAVQSQNFFSFPQGFKPEEWNVYGYLQGTRLNKKNHVTLDCFDSFSFIKFTTNEKGKKVFMEVMAYRINQVNKSKKEKGITNKGSQWTLILEKK